MCCFLSFFGYNTFGFFLPFAIPDFFGSNISLFDLLSRPRFSSFFGSNTLLVFRSPFPDFFGSNISWFDPLSRPFFSCSLISLYFFLPIFAFFFSLFFFSLPFSSFLFLLSFFLATGLFLAS